MIVEVIVRFFLAAVGVEQSVEAWDNALVQRLQSVAIGEQVVARYGQPLVRDGRVINPDRWFYVFTVREELPDHLRVTADGIEGWLRRDKAILLDKAVAYYTAEINQRLVDEAFNWRGQVHQHRGEWAEALADFDAAIRLQPSEPWGYRNRAVYFDKRGDRAGAIRAYDDLIRLSPHSVDDIMERAGLHWQVREFDAAFADAEATLALQPEHPWALAIRGGVRSVRGDLRGGLGDLDAAIRLRPDYDFALDKRAATYLLLGDTERAVSDAVRAVALDSNDCTYQMTLGTALLSRKQYARASHACGEAIRLAPGWAAAWSNRGASRIMLHEPDGARADLDEAIRLDPRHAPAYANRGICKMMQHQYDEAISDFDEAIKLNHNDAKSTHYRAGLFQRRGEYAAARTDFARAVELQPDHPDYLVNRAWLLAACPEAAVRDGEAAVRAATHACEVSKWSNANALAALAAAHAELEDYDRATQRIREALVVIGGESEGRAFYESLQALFEQQQPYRMERDAP